MPRIQDGHHTADAQQVLLEDLIQVVAAGGAALDDDAMLVVDKEAHVEKGFLPEDKLGGGDRGEEGFGSEAESGCAPRVHRATCASKHVVLDARRSGAPHAQGALHLPQGILPTPGPV